MRILCFIIPLLFAGQLPAADSPAPMMDGSWSIGSDFLPPDSVQFVSRVYREQVVRTPAWNPDSEFPPVSPRKAEAAAEAMLRKVMGERHWAQPDISLKPFDVTTDEGNHRELRWIYVLHFGLMSDVDNSQAGSINIIVLTDGTAVEPRPVVPKPVAPKPATTNAPPVKPAAPAKPGAA